VQNYYQAPSENRRRNRRINPGIWSACGSPVLHLCYDVGCFSVTVAEIIAATAVTEQAEAEEAYGCRNRPAPYANVAQTAAEAAEAELNATQAAAESLDWEPINRGRRGSDCLSRGGGSGRRSGR
jgi:hypothetical protein